MFIKICGCRRPEDAAAAAAAGVSAVGLVLAPGFRRSLEPAAALQVRAAVPPGVWAVGVFVGQPLAAVRAAVEALALDAVQLHGEGGETVAAALRPICRVVRAWSGSGPPPEQADYVLAEPHADRGGGFGRPWDWSGAAAWGLPQPLILSGGLDPDNVVAACEAVRPWGVDVSSGVERDGVKDPGRMAAFCAAVRAWAQGHGADSPPPRRA